MKTEVIASVTTLINVYETKLTMHRKYETLSLVQEMEIKEFIENLNNLLVYIEDVQEFENSLKADYEAILKERETLRESIENMVVVERNLHRKIAQLRDDNKMWQIVCTGLRNKLERTEREGIKCI